MPCERVIDTVWLEPDSEEAIRHAQVDRHCVRAGSDACTGRGGRRRRAVLRELDGRTDVHFMGEFACDGQPTTVAGPGLNSGSVRVTETADLEAAHVRLAIEGSIDLYEASGSPEDVEFGAYVGTWTYTGHQVEQYNPGAEVSTGVAHGEIVFADGTRLGSRSVSRSSSTLRATRSCSSPRPPAAESDVNARRRPGSVRASGEAMRRSAVSTDRSARAAEGLDHASIRCGRSRSSRFCSTPGYRIRVATVRDRTPSRWQSSRPKSIEASDLGITRSSL